jgi:hypothetical protein
MSDEAKQHLQGIVNDRYEAFIGAVARGRKVSQKRVRNGFGEGRLVTAREALSMGMVDSIETMDSVLSRTSGRAERAKKIAETTWWEFARIGDEGLSELSSTVMSVTATDMISQNREDFRAQMLIVSKDKWSSLDDARTWAKEKGYRADRVEEVGETWRLFQRDQSDFQSLRSVDLDSGIMAVGGQLKGGVSSVFRDADAEGVDEFLTVGVIPQDVSDELAAEGTKWSEPTIASFTSKAWEELTEDERRHIARHAAWCKAMPPERFEDIRLFYHEAEGGAIVPNGIRAALAQLDDDDLGEPANAHSCQAVVGHAMLRDVERIQARLSYHMAAIDKRNEQTKGDPSLDPERVELELMELG